MTTLKAFDVTGVVEEVLVAHTFGSHISHPFDDITVLMGQGIKGDNHAGRRLADAREKDLTNFGLLKRIEIANYRQWSAISVEEMAGVAIDMGIPDIPQGLLGENLIVSGIPNFSQLPSGTKLMFKKKGVPQTAVLAVWKYNGPCDIPGKALQEQFREMTDSGTIATRFCRHALTRRGLVGSVYCSGVISKGDTVIAKIPDQHIYEPPQQA